MNKFIITSEKNGSKYWWTGTGWGERQVCKQYDTAKEAVAAFLKVNRIVREDYIVTLRKGIE